MSFQAMAWAIKQKVGSATGKALLLMLANYADEYGRCFPSQETLSEECECSVRAVSSWLKKFEEFGFINRETRYRDGGYRTSDLIVLDIENQHANISHENISRENNSNLTCKSFQSHMHEVQSNNLSVNLSGNLSVSNAREKKREIEKQFEKEFAETFWPEYPHKVGKPRAKAKFIKARHSEALEPIMDGLRRYIKNKPPDRNWLNPETFLNQERWNDNPAPEPTRGHHNATATNHQEPYADRMREAVFKSCERLEAARFGEPYSEDMAFGFQGREGTFGKREEEHRKHNFNGAELTIVTSK